MERSKSIKKIAGALAKFHAKMKPIQKDMANSEFNSRYASLNTILNTIAGPLEAAGLVISQFPIGENGLQTMLIHSASGEFMQSEFFMKPTKETPTDIGAILTYLRRYSLLSVLSLNVINDKPTGAPSAAVIPEEDAEWMNEAQYHKLIKRIAAGEPDIFKKACTTFKMSDTARAGLKKAEADQQNKVSTKKEKAV